MIFIMQGKPSLMASGVLHNFFTATLLYCLTVQQALSCQFCLTVVPSTKTIAFTSLVAPPLHREEGSGTAPLLKLFFSTETAFHHNSGNGAIPDSSSSWEVAGPRLSSYRLSVWSSHDSLHTSVWPFRTISLYSINSNGRHVHVVMGWCWSSAIMPSSEILIYSLHGMAPTHDEWTRDNVWTLMGQAEASTIQPYLLYDTVCHCRSVLELRIITQKVYDDWNFNNMSMFLLMSLYLATMRMLSWSSCNMQYKSWWVWPRSANVDVDQPLVHGCPLGSLRIKRVGKARLACTRSA